MEDAAARDAGIGDDFSGEQLATVREMRMEISKRVECFIRKN
jgi:hypothetical protein